MKMSMNNYIAKAKANSGNENKVLAVEENRVRLADGNHDYWIRKNTTIEPIVGTAMRVDGGYIYEFNNGMEFYAD